MMTRQPKILMIVTDEEHADELAGGTPPPANRNDRLRRRYLLKLLCDDDGVHLFPPGDEHWQAETAHSRMSSRRPTSPWEFDDLKAM